MHFNILASKEKLTDAHFISITSNFEGRNILWTQLYEREIRVIVKIVNYIAKLTQA